MRVALIGASGYVGRPILEEALARGHRVTALVTQPSKLEQVQHLELRRVDALDTDALSAELRGHDALISAFSGHAHEDVFGYYVRGIRSIIEAAKRAEVPRLLVVGGAASLEVQPGVELIETPGFPTQWLATAKAAREALKILRAEPALNWTMLSPSAHLEPGPRTGKFRLGENTLLKDANGNSHISLADYAVAMIDELETPRHVRQRFTVGY
jgi:putative NADH-flavin reductase